MKVIKTAHHRNGIGGEMFHVGIVEDQGKKILVVHFEAKGHTAAFDIDLLSKQVIEFGENSWRGDVYEAEIAPSIVAMEKEKSDNQLRKAGLK